MESKMFLGVQVEIDEKEVAFNFLISENAYGMNCKLIAAGYSAYIDQDLFRFSGDMPDSWTIKNSPRQPKGMETFQDK